MTDPRDIPDEATVYVPGFGETTAGALRDSPGPSGDAFEPTLRFWAAKALNPELANPWENSGHTSQESAA